MVGRALSGLLAPRGAAARPQARGAAAAASCASAIAAPSALGAAARARAGRAAVAAASLPCAATRCAVPAAAAPAAARPGAAAAARGLWRLAPLAAAAPRAAPVRRAGGGAAEFDVLGVGQGIVDYSVTVPPEVLSALGLEAGGRRVIGAEERTAAIALLTNRGCPSRVTAGGSLANSLVGLARLGAAGAGRGLRVAMAGAIGGDPLGEFFAGQLAAGGVAMAAPPPAGSQTGTVVVLTTPDAQRAFLSCFPPEPLVVDAALEAAAGRCRLLVVEGYLWELPGAAEGIARLMAAAKRGGALVVMSAGDAGVVQRHGDDVRAALANGVDMLFANAGEAAALLGLGAGGGGAAPGDSAERAARALAATVPFVVVTDGERGSCLAAGGEAVLVPPYWNTSAPVDTCGAGDAYAAGLLYAYLRGDDLRAMGALAARVASAVISRHGAALAPEDAEAALAAAAAAAAASAVAASAGGGGAPAAAGGDPAAAVRGLPLELLGAATRSRDDESPRQSPRMCYSA